jgi:hypothetical protein
MINRYLTGDPLPWLTDGADPAVAYLVLREFGDGSSHNPPETDFFISYLLKHPAKQNIPGNQKNIDLFYRGALWFFLYASECGLISGQGFMDDTAEFLNNNISADDGGFSFHCIPPLSTGCRTGNMVKAFLHSGLFPERAEKGLNWIKKNQRQDGGWLHCPYSGICDSFNLMIFRKPGDGLKFENIRSKESCPVATAACIHALIESGVSEHIESINRGAEFFLSRLHLYQKKRYILQCGQSITLNAEGYPVMTQVDPVSVLIIIFSSDLWNDKRAGLIFNRVMKKQKSAGIWESNNTFPGMVRGKGADRWVTLNVLRMLKILSEKEDQLSKA